MKRLLLALLLLTLTGCATVEPPPAVEVMAPVEAPPVLSLGLAATAFFPLVSIPAIVILVIALNWLVYEVLCRIPIVRTWLV